MHLPKFPKVLALGHRTIKRIWDGPVEITEKVDGSQFSFGKPESDVICRTRRTVLYNAQPDKMFKDAIRHVESVQNKLDPDYLFFGEQLARPKHNVLVYDKVPKGHIAPFGVMNRHSQEMVRYDGIKSWAKELEMDVVPLLWAGEVSAQWKGHEAELVIDLLDTESFLGGPKVEGVVVKNYEHDAMIGEGHYYPYLVGKYVSEKFREKHGRNAYGSQKTKSDWEAYKDSFRTEARWLKAIQHLREDGTLLGEPKDIGPLMKEIQIDLEDEHKEEIMEFLYKLYRKELLGRSTQGFAEWYKQMLLEGKIDAS